MLFATMNAFAQDIITKKNGEEIQAKVLNVNDTEINYIKWTNQNGPTYTIAVSEVFMIKYENGEKDIFNKETSSATQTPQTPVQTAFSQEGIKQMKQNNLDLLNRQDLLKRAKRCNRWGKGLFWTFFIGGTAGMCFALAPDYKAGPTIGAALGVGAVSIIPWAVLSAKANRLESEASTISVASLPLKRFSVGNVDVEPNVNLLSCDIGKTRAFGLGARFSF